MIARRLMTTLAAAVLTAVLTAVPSAVQTAVVPDNCFCDAHHQVHGAACAGRPALDCGFSLGETFADVLDCMATLVYSLHLSG